MKAANNCRCTEWQLEWTDSDFREYRYVVDKQRATADFLCGISCGFKKTVSREFSCCILLEFKCLTKQRKAHAAGLENESSQQLPLNRLAIGVE